MVTKTQSKPDGAKRPKKAELEVKLKKAKKAVKRPKAKKKQVVAPELSATEIVLNERIVSSMRYRFDGGDAFDFGEANDQGNYIIDLQRLSPVHVDDLFNYPLSTKSKRRLTDFLVGDITTADMFDREVGSIRELGHVLQAYRYGKDKGNNVELKVLNRWYPVKVDFRLWSSLFGETLAFETTIALSATGETVELRRRLTGASMLDSAGVPVRKTVSQLFGDVGLRRLTDSRDNDQRLVRATELATHHGRQVMVNASGVCKDDSWFSSGLEEVRIGTAHAPRRGILEPELEMDEDNRDDDAQASLLPFVRVFSMDLKRYVYVDVADVTEYRPDPRALERLVLPPDVLDLVSRLFKTHVDDLFGDLLTFKHGGMIICAEGPTGVGKTLTAECFAEHTGRPLYPIELGELSTKIDRIEDNLRTIFTRAKRWNAVLLFDEADVLFQKRDDNLERSAIVGIFLRLLDYYNGFLFLTTNRLDVMDPAFESRITLTLTYKELDRAKRKRVWSNMFEAAGMQVSIPVIDELSAFRTNGRQIRSMVRLARSFFGNAPALSQLEGLVWTQVKNAVREVTTDVPTVLPEAPVPARRYGLDALGD